MDEIEEQLYELVADFTGKKLYDLPPDLLISSIENFELLLAEIEDEFDVVISDEDVEGVEKLGDLIVKLKQIIADTEEADNDSDN